MIVDVTMATATSDHWAGQSETRRAIKAIGGNATRWLMGSTSPDGRHLHKWRVKATDEEVTALALKAFSISTAYYESQLAEIASLESIIAEHQEKISEIKKEIY